ncbi:MAG: hypothetical protein F4X97_03200 [Boseongicola sp. SB0662_bin_57]|nr:hypothetical protein [Boseongicola sp. SB0662_bin_57]
MRAAVPSAVLIAAIMAMPVWADGFRVRTEAGLTSSSADATSLEADLGNRDTRALNAAARLMWDSFEGPFRLEVHAQFNAAHGSRIALTSALMPAEGPPRTLLDLSGDWSHDPDQAVVGVIDRASVAYAGENLVLKAGRQAITWGSGLFFHPSDIVAPFSPDAVDTSYKPGVDMLYAQYLFDNGADIQTIAVPRAEARGGAVSLDQSTLAIRGSTTLGSLDGALFHARDRGDSVAGLNLSGPLGGASWNAEYVHWRLTDGTAHPSWLFNITNFGTLGDWNVSYFAEYFRSGFGVDASLPSDALPASLTKRMSAGQVFFGGQDFLAPGGQIQVTADLSISPRAIFNLNDGSRLATVSVNYALGDNTDLAFDYSSPFGADGSEFGGRETSAGSGIFAGPSRSATLRLIHFF